MRGSLAILLDRDRNSAAVRSATSSRDGDFFLERRLKYAANRVFCHHPRFRNSAPLRHDLRNGRYSNRVPVAIRSEHDIIMINLFRALLHAFSIPQSWFAFHRSTIRSTSIAMTVSAVSIRPSYNKRCDHADPTLTMKITSEHCR